MSMRIASGSFYFLLSRNVTGFTLLQYNHTANEEKDSRFKMSNCTGDFEADTYNTTLIWKNLQEEFDDTCSGKKEICRKNFTCSNNICEPDCIQPSMLYGVLGKFKSAITENDCRKYVTDFNKTICGNGSCSLTNVTGKLFINTQWPEKLPCNELKSNLLPDGVDVEANCRRCYRKCSSLVYCRFNLRKKSTTIPGTSSTIFRQTSTPSISSTGSSQDYTLKETTTRTASKSTNTSVYVTQSKNNNVVVGSAVGTVIILVLAAILVLFVCRRKKLSQQKRKDDHKHHTGGITNCAYNPDEVNTVSTNAYMKSEATTTSQYPNQDYQEIGKLDSDEHVYADAECNYRQYKYDYVQVKGTLNNTTMTPAAAAADILGNYELAQPVNQSNNDNYFKLEPQAEEKCGDNYFILEREQRNAKSAGENLDNVYNALNEDHKCRSSGSAENEYHHLREIIRSETKTVEVTSDYDIFKTSSVNKTVTINDDYDHCTPKCPE